MARILISRDYPSAGLDLLEAAGHQLTRNDSDIPMTQSELIAACQGHDALMSTGTDLIDAHFLITCSHLKIIAQYAVGYDNIDLKAATSQQTLISNTPDAMSEATADVAFGLMIAVARRMIHMHKSIARGEWSTFKPKANLGLELKGKTLGIFGLGRIGIKMAERCQGAYQMPIIYHNRNRDIGIESRLKAKFVGFEDLLAHSDVLSVHSPLSAETRGIFDRSAFAKMKSEAIFINTSRGGVHNEEDLIEALQGNKIWGAGLDVTSPEPMDPENVLLDMHNACVLPHIGSATVEARDEMSRIAARNIISFFEHGKAPNALNTFSR